MYQQQPPYEQDRHMQPVVQIGGPGQQQPQPKFIVLPTGQQYRTHMKLPPPLPTPSFCWLGLATSMGGGLIIEYV